MYTDPKGSLMRTLGLLLLPLLFACQSTTGSSNSAECNNVATLTLGTPVTGALSSTDCTVSEDREDNFSLTLASPTVLSVNYSPSFTGEIEILNQAAPSAEQELVTHGAGQFYIALPAGVYGVQVMGSPSTTGSYTLAVASSSQPAGCYGPNTPMFIARGGGVTGALTTSDCVNNSYYADVFSFRGVAGQTYTFTSNANVGINLEINRAGAVQIFGLNNNPGVATVTFHPTATDMYNIGVIGIPQTKTGTYTFSMQ